MADAQTCVTCGKQAPETETNYTLISAQFGWRLTRYKRADGALVLEWRCPTCWREFKRTRTGATTSTASGASGPVNRPDQRPSSFPPASSDIAPAPQMPGKTGRQPR